MRAIRQVVRKLDHQNRLIADQGCAWTERLLESLTGSVLNEFQEGLWYQLAETEHHIRALKRREKRRKRRWNRFPKPDREAAEARDQHLQYMEKRRLVLEERRRILRELGDACAWTVLRADSRNIRPLYSGSRTHQTPDGIGAIGPLSVMREANASGKFLALNADLTRYLGIGDLVIVPAEILWVRPMVFEVKTRREGDDVAIWLIGFRPALPTEEEILAEFSRTTGFEVYPPFPLREREARQAQEIQDGSAHALDLWHRIASVLPTSGEIHWRVMEQVLTRARQDGFAFDAIEEGIFYAAVRNAPGDDSEWLTSKCLRRITGAGIALTNFHMFSSLELHFSGELSSVVLPIPLWNLPRELRVSLLNEEIYLHSIIHRSVWQRAFQQHRIGWLEEKGWWRLSRGKRHMALDPMETVKLRINVAFSALSPGVIAQNIAQALNKPEAADESR